MNPATKKSGPSWAQGLLLFFGGIVLAFSFCMGAFGQGQSGWATLLVIGFVVSVFMIFFGAVSLLLRLIRGSEK